MIDIPLINSGPKILLTGGTGLLGSKLKELKPSIIAPCRKELDVLNPRSIHTCLMYHRPDIIIHAAAITQAKYMELPEDSRYDILYSTNAVATTAFAKMVKDLSKGSCDFVYISTDYVFDGKKEGGLYREDDYPCPTNVYSYTKLLGEMAIIALNYKIIRTSFCPMVWEHPYAFTDKITTGDTVDIIANLILKLVEKNKLWNLTVNVGTERKTFFQLAQKTKKDVIPNSISDIKNIVIPKDTSLNTMNMHRIFSKGLIHGIES